ncbi:MAG: hypothetical protein LM567_05555 [Desulfurococcaceae archaeon]|nr:hypothetical protein [Desulfurococcaceae archaeon]
MNNIYKRVFIAIVLLFTTMILVANSLTPLRIHVYNDGSIVVEYSHSMSIEYSSRGVILVQSILGVNDNYYEILGNLSGETGSTCISKYNCTYIEFIANTTSKISGEYYEVTSKFNLSIWDDKNNSLNATIDPLNYKLNITSLIGVLSGVVELNAIGEAKEVYATLAMLNKPIIENYLAQSNITWIKINTLTTTISNEKARVEFEIEVDESKLAENLELNTTSIRELYKNTPSSTINTYLYFNITHIYTEFSIRVNSNINEQFKYTTNFYKEAYVKLEKTIFEILKSMGIQISTNNIKSILNILDEITNTFNIMKSRGELVVKIKDNTINLNITTPRLIKKDSKTPKDTLIALYNLAVRIQSELGVRELLDTIVELIPESGVKITRNGTEVQQVKLREIPELEVTTTTPILQTPLVITVGAIVILAAIIIVIIKLKKK